MPYYSPLCEVKDIIPVASRLGDAIERLVNPTSKKMHGMRPRECHSVVRGSEYWCTGSATTDSFFVFVNDLRTDFWIFNCLKLTR